MTKTRNLSQAELARTLKVSENSVREWRARGCPCTANNNRVYFTLTEVLRWRKQRAAQRSSESMDSLKVRKLDLQNRLRQLRLDLAEGRLIDKAEAVAEMQQTVSNAKNKLLAMGTRTAPYLLGKTQAEIQDILDGEFYEILKEMTESLPTSLAGAAPRR